MQGFSILEAMAALMVLNLLCLGLMAWQLQAMQAQRQALALQQAVAMAQDLWHRMQVHPGAWQWYQLEMDGATPAGDCRQAACNAQQWAQADLGEWLNEWRQRLPRTLYLKLTEQAKNEGVSINSLVTAMIAEAIGSRQPRQARRR